jgi:hypothetical protein
MSNLLRILKVNPVRSGIAQQSQQPYEWHTAECALLDESGSVQSVGVMHFPRELRAKLGGVPPVGTYRPVIAMRVIEGPSAREIRPHIIDLVPVAGEGEKPTTAPIQ